MQNKFYGHLILTDPQGFDVRLLSDSYTIFHAPNTRPQARLLMSDYWQRVVMSSIYLTSCRGFDIRLLWTFVQSSMHQRSDYKPGILMPGDR